MKFSPSLRPTPPTCDDDDDDNGNSDEDDDEGQRREYQQKPVVENVFFKKCLFNIKISLIKEINLLISLHFHITNRH